MVGARYALLLALVGCDQLFGVGVIPALTDGPPAPSCLFTTFEGSELDPIHWALWKTPGGPPLPMVAVADGVLSVAPLTSTDATPEYDGADTVATFDLTDGTVVVEVVEATLQNASTAAVETQFRLIADANDEYLFAIAKQQLQARQYSGSATPDYTTVAYNATSNRWLRFRHDSATGQMHYDVSPTGAADAWVTVIAFPAKATLTGLRVGVGAGTYGAVTHPGEARFDNVRVTAPACLP